mgnify:CR=1 FL=1
MLDELKGSEVEVAYGIDSNTERMYADINIISPDAPFEEVFSISTVPSIDNPSMIKYSMYGYV